MVELLANSAFRLKVRPLVTKKIGMKTPKPIASSLSRNWGWVVVSSRSRSESSAPAANAPRIVSRPTLSASAAAAGPTPVRSGHDYLVGPLSGFDPD